MLRFTHIIVKNFKPRSISEVSTKYNPFLNNKLLEVKTKPIYWERTGITRYTSDIGNGVSASVYIGAEDHDTCICVSLDTDHICEKIGPIWLENWFIKE
jgi:hypothetical protein